MKFSASLASLVKIMEYVRSSLGRYGLDVATSRKIELVCEEAIVNVILYAYKSASGDVNIVFQRNNNRLEITIQDFGTPFNPLDAKINLQDKVPIQKRKEGGVGIFLMKKMVDEISYKRDADANVLRFAINLS